MRILMAADVPPDPDSGAAGTEYQTMLALCAAGHTVEAIWRDDLPHRIRHGNLHYLLELPWAYRDAIAGRWRARDYDVIHVNQPAAWLAARDHRRRRRPGVFVNRSHGWEPRIAEALRPWRRIYHVPEWRFPRGLVGRPLQWVLNGLYARACARACDGVIVSCSEDRDYLLAAYRLSSEQIACIPQAPARVFVSMPAPPLTEIRKRRLLYVGQCAFFKAPDVLAAVFTTLAERHADLEFTWCCPAADPVCCREKLGPAARARVRFEGWRPQVELVRLFDEHGIFVFPSFAEGFGKVFLEAMARGLCVVGSNIGGMRDVIESGVTGLLVEPGDVEGFCRAVESVLASERAAAMSDAAAASARRYSWERTARETVEFYQRLLEMKGAVPAPAI